MTTPEGIAGVPEELFSRVWEFVKMCEEREKHFNDIQSRYRTLASTWLLASFAGIGFALSTNLRTGVHWEVLVGGLGIVGGIGIALVWVVDVLVYHELLIAGHVAGQQLEKAFQWLPPIRSHFSVPKRSMAVRTYTAMFYAGGIAALSITSTLSLLLIGSTVSTYAVVPGVLGLCLIAMIFVLTSRALDWKQRLPKWVTQQDTNSREL